METRDPSDNPDMKIGRRTSSILPLQIVIPMAGLGSRFAREGYLEPKPLIAVGHTPMIKVVIDNLRPSRPHRFVFICQKQHVATYDLRSALSMWAPGCVIIELDGVTDGAACTVLQAEEIVQDFPLMIANSDQYVDMNIDHYLEYGDADLDGFMMTMCADDPKWSYARTDADGLVTEVAEKQVISNQATVGIYNFKRASDFSSNAHEMIDAELRVNGEFYVAPVYNLLIAKGGHVGVFDVGIAMHGLGTPSDLETFLSSSASDRFRQPL